MERNGGKEIRTLSESGVLKELHVWQLDRLGRNLLDILNTISYFNEKRICINFVSQGLKTLDQNGKENSVAKMILSILGVVGEMERNQIKERQLEGINIAKIKGVYLGRKKGTNEDVNQFLSKSKNKLALNYIKRGYKNSEIAKIVNLNVNTITKIKKLGLAK